VRRYRKSGHDKKGYTKKTVAHNGDKTQKETHKRFQTQFSFIPEYRLLNHQSAAFAPKMCWLRSSCGLNVMPNIRRPQG
jgi:hypothetical protein